VDEDGRTAGEYIVGVGVGDGEVVDGGGFALVGGGGDLN
jgi:hypothetical protein